MIDFHSHLIPGIDDGSKSLAMSQSMLDMWKEQKISHICATPHFYADMMSPEKFLEKRDASYRELMDSVIKRSDGYRPAILPGAEVHYFRGMSSNDSISKFCLKGTKLILIEMPFHEWSEYMVKEVSDLKGQGLIPVAAHIERYLSIQPTKKIDAFLETGVLLQCNAEFFLTFKTKRKALRMLANNEIAFLGSDAHNTTNRCPNLGSAVEYINKKLGPEALSNIRRNEASLIDMWAQGGLA